MQKIILSVLLILSITNANNLELTLENKNQTHNEFMFFEPLDGGYIDGNTGYKISGYDTLTKQSNDVSLKLKSNFNDMIGFNYTNTLSGITYDSKELYIGTSAMKYFGYNKITKDVDYTSRDTKEEIDEFTFLNIMTITKEKLKSNKVETILALKALLHEELKDQVTVIPDTGNGETLQSNAIVTAHRNHELETFRISSENLYNVLENDLQNGEEYLNPIMFSKKINSNFEVYGLAILSLAQYNYTYIENYYNSDSNATKTNLSFSVNTQSDAILDMAQPTISSYFMSGKYEGYEYGFKTTAKYRLKNFSAFVTAYYKKLILSNKFDKETVRNGAIDTHSKIFYRKLEYVDKYINFGVSYNF